MNYIKKHKTLFTCLVLIVILCNIACGCTSKKYDTSNLDNRTVIKIAYLPITHSMAILVQNELQKENKDYKLELIKYGSWPDLTDALNSGKVDGAVELVELGMKAYKNGISLKAVALAHRDGNVIVTNKNINNISDLKGKTFAIPSKLSSHNILLNRMFEENDMTIDDVNIVELSPAEMPFSLVSGQISGYCVAEPFGAKAVNADVGKVFNTSDELWENSMCCVLTMRESFLKNNSNVSKKFIEDYKAAGDFIEENRKEAMNIGEKYLGIEGDVLRVSMEWISFNNLNINESEYSKLCEYLKKYNIMNDLPLYKEFINNQ